MSFPGQGYIIKDGIRVPGAYIYKTQADAVLSQANPVTDTYYTILDTSYKVRIKGAAITITWGVTQPTNLRIRFTIDGQSIIYTFASPVTATPYVLGKVVAGQAAAESAQVLIVAYSATAIDTFHEGQSVKVEMAVTWATTQPTPMVGRVKWERLEPI